MGTRDSSGTRVAPLFDRLFERDPTGSTWVDAVIHAGSRTDVVMTVARGQRLLRQHGRRWGNHEMRLPAPQQLLEYLVLNIDPTLMPLSPGRADQLRRRLAERDPQTVRAAIDALRSGQRGRRWFVLEGESRPDALLETEDLVLCIEGKRTERTCTTRTRWMPKRSQLVRHMDAAIESFPSKRVLGLLVVEGNGSSTPSSHWRAQSEQQHSNDMLDASLPHRSPSERERIASGVLGVTTWETLCNVVKIPFTTLPDAV